MISVAITASQCTGMQGYGCALRVGDRIVRGTDDARDLAVELQRLCASAGIDARALDEVRLDQGPGSYVGLRVAVTTATFLRRFAGARVLTTTSLELMASAALLSGADARGGIRPVLDGRRQRYHTAKIGVSGLVERPAALTGDELLKRIVPDELLLAAEPLHPLLLPRAERVGARLQVPTPVSAETMFTDSIEWREAGETELEPLYLMRSYAE